MTSFNDKFIGRGPVLGGAINPAGTTRSITTTWTSLSAGSGGAARFQLAESDTVTDVWVYQATAATGATNAVVELHEFSSATAAGTLLATTTVAASTSAAGWLKATFSSPVPLTAGKFYYLTVGSSHASNAFTVRVSSTAATVDLLANIFTGFGTAVAGAAAVSLAVNTSPAYILKLGSGKYEGGGFADTATDTSNALERGLKIRVDSPAEVNQVNWTVASLTSNVSGLKIYEDGVAPGGDTVFSYTPPDASQANAVGQMRFPGFTLRPGRTYRIVLTYSGASTAPSTSIIPDYAGTHATALAAVNAWDVQGICHTISNGSGDWLDSPDKLPRMNVIVNALATSEPDTLVATTITYVGTEPTEGVAETFRQVSAPADAETGSYDGTAFDVESGPDGVLTVELFRNTTYGRKRGKGKEVQFTTPDEGAYELPPSIG